MPWEIRARLNTSTLPHQIGAAYGKGAALTVSTSQSIHILIQMRVSLFNSEWMKVLQQHRLETKDANVEKCTSRIC